MHHISSIARVLPSISVRLKPSTRLHWEKCQSWLFPTCNFVFKISNDPRRWVFLLLPPFFPCLPTCQSDRKCIQHPNCVFSHLYPGWQILTTKTTEYLDFIILVANFKYILLLILNFLHDEEYNLWWWWRSYKTFSQCYQFGYEGKSYLEIDVHVTRIPM